MEIGVLDALKQWLIAHVPDDDRSFADDLHSQGKADIVPPLRFVVDPTWIFSDWTEPAHLLGNVGRHRGPDDGH
jgi:hypothetical protein